MIDYPTIVKNDCNVRTLPVPSLEQTMKEFILWSRPLNRPEEFKKLELEVEKFMDSSIADQLQESLLKKAAGNNDNWLADFWIKYSYLSSRGPICPECNACMMIDLSNLDSETIEERIALVIYATTVFYKSFKEGEIKEQLVKNKQYSLDQLHGLLAAIRKPAKNIDTYYINSDMSTHVAFSYKNHIYKITTIIDDQVLSPAEIMTQINEVINQELEVKEINANLISYSVDRDQAAELMEELLENDYNKHSQKLIDDSIIYVAYDEIKPQNEADYINNIQYTPGVANKYHGKGMNFVFDNQGNIGIIADHTYVDGGTEIFYLSSIDRIIGETSDLGKINREIKAEEINFEISDTLGKSLLKAREGFETYMANITFEKVIFEKLNRKELKECGILSADGFFHVGLQMAQIKTFDTMYNTYIAVDNRTFFKGRTECVRPISDESQGFISAFMDKNSNKSQVELKEMLLASLNEHFRRLKLCQDGFGVNRHLFGLKMTAKEMIEAGQLEKMPELFKLEATDIMASNRLSTSSLLTPYIVSGYFQPVDANGFGMFYAIGDKPYIAISSFKKDEELRKKFIKHLDESINQLVAFVKGV